MVVFLVNTYCDRHWSWVGETLNWAFKYNEIFEAYRSSV